MEVVEVSTGGGADTEGINHEGEGGVASEVAEEAVGTCFAVPVRSEVGDKLFIGKYASLGLTVYPLLILIITWSSWLIEIRLYWLIIS